VLGLGHAESGVMRATLEPGVRELAATVVTHAGGPAATAADGTAARRPVTMAHPASSAPGPTTAAPDRRTAVLGLLTAAGVLAVGRPSDAGAVLLAPVTDSRSAGADMLPLVLLLLALVGVGVEVRRRRTLAG
jgi:hypothetical protein